MTYIQIAEDYFDMSIGEKVILKLSSCVEGLLKLEWFDEWANWAEFQSSAEVQQLADRANAILEKQAKGQRQEQAKDLGTTEPSFTNVARCRSTRS